MSAMNNKFDGKCILITGASRGLGAIAAKHFADQGALCALVARNLDDLELVRKSCKYPEEQLTISVDLTLDNMSHFAVGSAQSFFNAPIDVVLHCMGGGLGLKEPILTAQELLKLWTINLGIAVEINSLVLPNMINKMSGNIVHVGSIASNEGVGSVGYNTSKAALSGYVRSLGREMAKHNVIVTGILPGGFISPGNSMARLKESFPEAYNDFIINRLPRTFMGQTEELLPMLSLLCSNEASMMSGCMVPIDAGEGRAYVK